MNATLGVIEKNFSQAQTEEMLNEIVTNDKQTYLNLEYTRVLLDDIIKRGNAFTPTQLQNYLATRNSFAERQNALKTDKNLKTKDWIDDNIITGFRAWLILKSRGLSGLGAIQVLPIAITAVAVLALTVALYYTFRPKYSDSVRDLKISKALKTALENLEPEVAQEVRDDLEKQIDDAYNAGNSQGTFDQLLTTGKYVLIGGSLLWAFLKVYPLVVNEVNKSQQKIAQ
jgi:hypothetical protein